MGLLQTPSEVTPLPGVSLAHQPCDDLSILSNIQTLPAWTGVNSPWRLPPLRVSAKGLGSSRRRGRSLQRKVITSSLHSRTVFSNTSRQAGSVIRFLLLL
jgi:hypothetical protein